MRIRRSRRQGKGRKGAALLCLLLATMLTGCQLARPETVAEVDRLIGVYVTLEPLDLFDFEAYFNDHAKELLAGGGEIGPEDAAAYGGRLYAVREEGGHGWRFPGVAGYAMFLYTYEDAYGSVTASCCDLSDATFSIGPESSAEGTLYIESNRFFCAYCNPVYQSADGSVYLTAGEGLSFSGDGILGTMTQTIAHESTTVAEAGEETVERVSVSATVHITPLDPPDCVAVQQMRADGSVLRRDVYAVDAVPETIAPAAETAYLIVEMLPDGKNHTGEAVRTILEPGDASFTTYRAGDDGVCLGLATVVEWPQAEDDAA